MFIKRIFWVLGLMSMALSGRSQQNPAPADITTRFRQAEAAMVLLRNEGDLLPLRRLDTLRIGVVCPGLSAGNEFEQTLGYYMPVENTWPAGPSAEEWEAWLRGLPLRYNLLIVGLPEWDSIPAGASYPIDAAVLGRLVSENRSIVAVFGEGRALYQFPELGDAQGLLLSPPGAYAESLAAQAVFGGVGVNGVLQRTWTPAFRQGQGLRTRGGGRLRYSPPEVVGMDRRRLVDSIEAIVREGIEKKAYPGAQVVVAKNGHVVYQNAFGFHTYDSLRAVRLDDVYDFASLTKISSGLPAAMKLVGEKRFDLDTPLSRYFPAFKGSNKAELSFRRLLTHSSQLLAWIPFWRATLKGNARYPWKKGWNGNQLNEGRFKSRTFRPDSSAKYPVRVTENLWLHRSYKQQLLKAIAKSPLNQKPGYVYSDLSFYLWPEIIPSLTGQDFESYLKSTFYRPIGAYSLTFNAYRQYPADRIVPTELDTFFRQALLQGTVHDEGAAMLSGISGHAGLFGSAGDLAKLMQVYLNRGSYGGEQLIAPEAVDEFTRYQYPEEGIRRGLGFDKPLFTYTPGESYSARSAGAASYGHTGYTGTFTWADPENQLLVVFFTNRVYPTRDNRKLITLGLRPRMHQACYYAIIR